MKQSFKNVALMLLAALAFSVTSCKDDKDDVAPTEQDAGCKLTSIKYAEEEDVVTLEYNAQGYLTKVIEVGEDDISTYIYDASNRLVKSEERTGGQLSSYTVFEYKDGLLSTVKYYEADGELEDTETYNYDANKRVIELSDADGDYTRFTYNSNGNVIKEERYYEDKLDSRTVYENYDDKLTPFSAIKGLVGADAGADGTLSKNNPGKATFTYFYNGEESYTRVETYSYKYNSNGFPTEVTETHEDGDSYTSMYTYQCK